jgi:hypothetical protein
MNVQSFIFIHNQDILLDCINNNKFNNLSNLKYIFVGNEDISKIKNHPDVIICRDLLTNIEDYPKLTSYTGWYALWKNNLIQSDYINLFEYDVDLSENFSSIFDESIIENNKIIGYIIYNAHDSSFLGHKEVSIDIVNSIYKNYNIKAYDYINNLPPNTLCSLTSNHTFNKQTFEEYMKWTEPMIDDIKNIPNCGHQIERSIPLFYLINQIEVVLIPDVLSHYQLNSHIRLHN